MTVLRWARAGRDDYLRQWCAMNPHVNNGENGYWHAAAACQQCRKWWIWPVCVEWRFQTYLSYLIVTYYTSPVDSNDIVSSLGLRRYILRQSRTGVKFLVLTRSSLNTAIWLLKMIEFLTCGSHMSAMTKMAIDMRQCKYVIWGVETGNWGDGHLGKMITCGNDVPWMEYVDE